MSITEACSAWNNAHDIEHLQQQLFYDTLASSYSLVPRGAAALFMTICARNCFCNVPHA